MKVLDGRPVPLFPLPSVVLYPRIVQPLHIFEPRYRQMLAEVLDSHGKIALALLKPGFESRYHDSPEIHAVVSVGTLVTYRTREDGSSDVVLLGECRARVVEEMEGKMYRRASLVRLQERQPHAVQQRENLRGRLGRWLRYAVDGLEGKKDSLARLQHSFKKESDVGFLVDFLVYHFLEETEVRQEMLEELDVSRRAETLLERLGDR